MGSLARARVIWRFPLVREGRWKGAVRVLRVVLRAVSGAGLGHLGEVGTLKDWLLPRTHIVESEAEPVTRV